MISGKTWEANMGGPGSGHWSRWQTKDTAERCRRIDIRDWQRRKFLRSGLGFSWGWWTREGSHVAAIHVQVQEGRVLLAYRLRHGGADWQDIEAPVALTWTHCHYGGQRPWFICPGEGCQRRVAILYGAGRDFLCRHCYDLVYDSQRQDHPTRLIAKAQQIRRRLGGSASLMAPFPPKPPGMHWRTYLRCWQAAAAAEEAGLEASLAQLERWHVRLLARDPSRED
jgi:hypothetical protein